MLTAAAAGAMAVLTAAGVATGQSNSPYPNALPGQPYPTKAAGRGPGDAGRPDHAG